ncbi:MAG: hypothetical protein GYB66_07115 [Chloroflexi bacterium]|nr:hypothetical protein [Chloroflexota bacterium]
MRDVDTVRGLEPDLEEAGIDVLLVNIHTETGAELSERYDFEFSPTYIVFDADGTERWRSNSVPDLERVLSILSSDI